MSLAAAATAQEHAGSVYVAAGVSFPHQAGPQGGKSSFSAPGGNTVGWLVGGGVFVSPRVSIEGEISSTGVMTSTQSSRGSVFDGDRCDRFISLAVKGHLPLRRAVRLEPVGGIVLIEPADPSILYSRYEGPLLNRLVPSVKYKVDLASSVGFLFGGDLRIGGRHLAFVPALRIAYTGVSHGVAQGCDPVRGTCGTAIDSKISSIYPSGYPKWTQRPSLSLAVNF